MHSFGKNLKKFTLRNSLAAIDLFPAKVPNFNIRGATNVTSVGGSILSCMVLLILVFYGANKLTHMLERRNPTISSFTERDAVTKDDELSLKGTGLRFAFGVEGFLDKELKDDPAYVKWYVRKVNRIDGIES